MLWSACNVWSAASSSSVIVLCIFCWPRQHRESLSIQQIAFLSNALRNVSLSNWTNTIKSKDNLQSQRFRLFTPPLSINTCTTSLGNTEWTLTWQQTRMGGHSTLQSTAKWCCITIVKILGKTRAYDSFREALLKTRPLSKKRALLDVAYPHRTADLGQAFYGGFLTD